MQRIFDHCSYCRPMFGTAGGGGPGSYGCCCNNKLMQVENHFISIYEKLKMIEEKMNQNNLKQST